MIIITHQYSPNIINGTDQCDMMVKSFERHGHEVAVLREKWQGNGMVFKHLLACFKRAATGHELFIYSDGADTYCQRKIEESEIPTDYILYSTEKNCYPKPEMAKKYPAGKSPWKFLNGGGYCGPLHLIIAFFEKYGLDKHSNDCNGQHEQMAAYLKAVEDGFPIKLDTECRLFQTTAWADPLEFEYRDGLIRNVKTGTTPAIFHGNGRSDMAWVYSPAESNVPKPEVELPKPKKTGGRKKK